MARLCSVSIALVLSVWLMLPGSAAAERWRQDPNIGWHRTTCCCCGGQFFFRSGYGNPPSFPSFDAYYQAPPAPFVPAPIGFTPRPASLGAALPNGCRVYNAPLGPGGLTAPGRGTACPLKNGSWRVTQ
jgi:hypothetical protein